MSRLGLLALLLAHDARRDARVDATGALVLLPDQDRALWDRAAIARSTDLAARALRLGPPGRYVLQAAIAVEHANAPTAAATRWDRNAAYYSHLAALAPDPIVELNRAVALAMAGHLDDGLARIDALAAALDRYHYFHAARADLLRRRGERGAAAAAYARAEQLAGNAAERAFLRRPERDRGIDANARTGRSRRAPVRAAPYPKASPARRGRSETARDRCSPCSGLLPVMPPNAERLRHWLRRAGRAKVGRGEEISSLARCRATRPPLRGAARATGRRVPPPRARPRPRRCRS